MSRTKLKSKTKSSSKTVALIHGPNLNLLGLRDTNVYGRESLDQIEAKLTKEAKSQGIALTCVQSNSESELIDAIQQAIRGGVSGIIINPGAYTHTSVAIRDALECAKCPVVEVHLSNIFKREAFRHDSMVSPVATGVISGFGSRGYEMALSLLI